MLIRARVLMVGVIVCAPVAAAAQDHVNGVETKVVDVKNPRGPVQKLLVTRPAGAARKLPAILVLPWMDCSTLTIPAEKLHGFQQVMRHLVESSGMVVGRIEKPGVGGSEGVCRDTDFETELEGFRAALARLAIDEWSGGTLILAGQSYTGGILPLVAGDRAVEGYIVISSWVRTWLERLLEFERNQMLRAGISPAELADRMRAFGLLYGIYLNEGMTPGQVIESRPALKAVWTGDGTHQYGRPAAFFHQLQRLNLEQAWAGVSQPTLLFWGDRDLAMHRLDHERIAALVNQNRPAAATLSVLSNADHSLLTGRELAAGVTARLDEWLRQFVSR